MAAYRRVYDSRHLQADCQEPGSAPEPYARQSSMGFFYRFIRCFTVPVSAVSATETASGAGRRHVGGIDDRLAPI